MGLIERYKNNRQNKFNKKMAAYFNSKGGNDMNYNPLLVDMNKKDTTEMRFTRRMLENSTWYAGDDVQLSYFYRKEAPKFRFNNFSPSFLNYFWALPTEDSNVRKLHGGIPQLISEKMVDLLIGNGYEFKIHLDDEEMDDENTERLNDILQDNKFHTLLQEAIETESWSGGVAFKLSVHPSFEYPIIEVVQPEHYEAKVVAGRIVEDIFLTYYIRGDNHFKLKEKYGVDENGSYIRYELERLVQKGVNKDQAQWEKVELSALPETADYEDIEINGLFKKLSIYKPNKTPNSEFRGSKMGESDYSGSHGAFDAIDEILSTWIQEFRDGKLARFWPSNLMPFDPETGKQYMPPELQKDFIAYNGGIAEDNQPTKIEFLQGNIDTDKHLESFKKWLEVALNNAGLSPLTVGVTGLEAMNAGEASQKEREKVSIRTREKKLRLWEETLMEFLPTILILDDIKESLGKGTTPTIEEYEPIIVFSDYILKSKADRVTETAEGLLAGVYDLKTAIEYVHEDKTEDEQTLIRVNVKIEKGIGTFTKEEEAVYLEYINELEIEEPEQTQTDIEPEPEEEPEIEEEE